MSRELKLLAVLAHPDDESRGFGGTLAKYAAARHSFANAVIAGKYALPRLRWRH